MIKNPLPTYPNFYFNMIRTTINFCLIWPMNNKDKNSFVGSIINFVYTFPTSSIVNVFS
jgi:hypothetical protein